VSLPVQPFGMFNDIIPLPSRRLPYFPPGVCCVHDSFLRFSAKETGVFFSYFLLFLLDRLFCHRVAGWASDSDGERILLAPLTPRLCPHGSPSSFSLLLLLSFLMAGFLIAFSISPLFGFLLGPNLINARGNEWSVLSISRLQLSMGFSDFPQWTTAAFFPPFTFSFNSRIVFGVLHTIRPIRTVRSKRPLRRAWDNREGILLIAIFFLLLAPGLFAAWFCVQSLVS